MGTENTADVIIVGGGIAGLAAAYALTKKGKSVVLLERGTSCGSKNMTGGRIYTPALRELLGTAVLREAPLERRVVKEQLSIVHGNSSTTLDYMDESAEKENFESCTILRSVFDKWLAGKAEEMGAMIITGTQADHLIEEDGRITGVYAAGEELLADVVIAADGIHSFIAQQAGLKQDIQCSGVGIGVKEVITLSEDIINNRFSLQKGEGAAHLFLGVTPGINGGGFLYTNTDSISLGMVVNPRELSMQEKTIHELFREFKASRSISPLIAQGKTAEYSAHLVHEMGFKGVPRTICRNGLLIVGDAAGFVINMGTTIRGMDLAVWSGIAAAEAIVAAPSSAEISKQYTKRIHERILPLMKRYKRYPQLLAIPRVFTEYPDAANQIMHAVFAIDGHRVPPKLTKEMWNILRHSVGIKHLISDSWEAIRSL